jgi:hypothetical protein
MAVDRVLTNPTMVWDKNVRVMVPLRQPEIREARPKAPVSAPESKGRPHERSGLKGGGTWQRTTGACQGNPLPNSPTCERSCRRAKPPHVRSKRSKDTSRSGVLHFRVVGVRTDVLDAASLDQVFPCVPTASDFAYLLSGWEDRPHGDGRFRAPAVGSGIMNRPAWRNSIGGVDWSKGRRVRHESNGRETVSCGGEGA